MNEVYVIGKVVSKIVFKFILKSKNISVAIFDIETNNKQQIRIEANNELADFVYRNINKDMSVFIEGFLHENIVKIKEIEILDKWF